MYNFILDINELKNYNKELKKNMKFIKAELKNIYETLNNITDIWMDPNAQVFLETIKDDYSKAINILSSTNNLNKQIENFCDVLINLVNIYYTKLEKPKLEYNNTKIKNLMINLQFSIKSINNIKKITNEIEIPIDFEFRDQLLNLNKYALNLENNINDIYVKTKNFSNDIEKELKKVKENTNLIEIIKLKKVDRKYIWDTIPINNKFKLERKKINKYNRVDFKKISSNQKLNHSNTSSSTINLENLFD